MYLPSLIEMVYYLFFFVLFFCYRNTFYSLTDHSVVILISRYFQGCGTKFWALGVSHSIGPHAYVIIDSKTSFSTG